MNIIEFVAIAAIIIAGVSIVGTVLITTGINIEHATTEHR